MNGLTLLPQDLYDLIDERLRPEDRYCIALSRLVDIPVPEKPVLNCFCSESKFPFDLSRCIVKRCSEPQILTNLEDVNSALGAGHARCASFLIDGVKKYFDRKHINGGKDVFRLFKEKCIRRWVYAAVEAKSVDCLQLVLDMFISYIQTIPRPYYGVYWDGKDLRVAEIFNIAAAEGFLEGLKLIQRAKPNPKSYDFEEAMMCASEHGHLDCIKYLSELYTPSFDEGSVYYYVMPHLECLKYMVEKGWLKLTSDLFYEVNDIRFPDLKNLIEIGCPYDPHDLTKHIVEVYEDIMSEPSNTDHSWELGGSYEAIEYMLNLNIPLSDILRNALTTCSFPYPYENPKKGKTHHIYDSDPSSP